MPTAVMVAGAIIGGVGTVASYNQQRKAARSQENIYQEQHKANRITYQRSLRQDIRSQQMARAQTVASAGAYGASMGNSSIQAGIGAMHSGVGEQQGFGNTMGQINNNISAQTANIGRYNTRAQAWGAVSQMGWQVSNYVAQGGLNQFMTQPGVYVPQTDYNTWNAN